MPAKMHPLLRRARAFAFDVLLLGSVLLASSCRQRATASHDVKGVGAVASLSATVNKGLSATPPAAARPTQKQGPLEYVLFTTQDASDAAPLPWLVAMHGLGDRPESFGNSLAKLPLAAHIYLLRAPITYGHGFDWFGVRLTDDPVRLATAIDAATAKVAELIAQLAQAPANLGKPGATGFSQGGILSYSLAVRYPERIAFAAPVGGWLPPASWPRAKPELTVPIFAFHGANDERLPLADTQRVWDALSAVGISVEQHVYPGLGHGMSRQLVDEWYTSLAQGLTDAPTKPATIP
ncbi:MAG TPA: dienelactone hydrolase family protein [Polyangiaceae bacterium]|nr:dienelactone hydrolase family protein [Polyangiaceae bacterium]